VLLSARDNDGLRGIGSSLRWLGELAVGLCPIETTER